MDRPRVLFCRYTLDGHDRGLITVINRCRDAGMEVIYINFIDAEEIAQVAIQEDVDIIGITSSMGEHFYVIKELFNLLKEKKCDLPVIVGGVIPAVDVPRLLEMGVKGVFGPGSSPEEAVNFISKIILEEAS